MGRRKEGSGKDTDLPILQNGISKVENQIPVSMDSI